LQLQTVAACNAVHPAFFAILGEVQARRSSEAGRTNPF
jgi:hypothetical protein